MTGFHQVTGEAEVQVGERDQPVVRKLVRMYRSNGNDVQWAPSGVVAKVINGEAIKVVQNRVEDAGFVDLDIIPMGADRVFLRSTLEKETSSLLEDAKDFFVHIFSNIVRLNKEVVPLRRGVIGPNRKCTAYRSNSSKKSIVPLGSCEFN